MAARLNRWTFLRAGGVALACAAVAVGASGCGGSSGAAISATSTTVAPPPTSAAHKAATGVSGRISAENGMSWVVTTKAGKQVTVTITTATKFGTSAHPTTQQQFPVGTTVRVVGRVDGGTVTASRIVVPEPKASQNPAPSTTAATPSISD